MLNTTHTNDLTRFKELAELCRYFAPDVINVVKPREVWIQNNAKILQQTDRLVTGQCPVNAPTMKLSTWANL